MSIELWKVKVFPAWLAGVARRQLLRRKYGFDAWHVRATPANRPYKRTAADMLASRQVHSVVDVGCGLGDIGGMLPGSVRYVGYDVSPQVVAGARHLHRHKPNLAFKQGSFAQAGGEHAEAVVSVAWVDGLDAAVLVEQLLLAAPNARFILIDAVTDKPDSHNHLTLQIPGYRQVAIQDPEQDPRLDRVVLLYQRALV